MLLIQKKLLGLGSVYIHDFLKNLVFGDICYSNPMFYEYS